MSHTVLRVRRLPNYKFYQLKLVRTENPVIVVAVLTQYAINLGVRFDNDLKDYRFNLSEFLGNDNGNWCTGTRFEATAKNIGLDLSDRENRCLIADLKRKDGGYDMRVKYNLDEVLGLSDYFHSDARQTYFRLGVRPRGLSKRTLVLCFDGTSNHFSSQNTNVVKLVELLKKDDPERQMVYYQTGVGTYTSPNWTNAITQEVAKRLDEGVAWYLYHHVIDGYKYLMEAYRDGDRIFIFGFSRGAYTARALAGMLHCVGLLPRHNTEHVPFAYEIYASGGRPEGSSWWETMRSCSNQVFESIFPLSATIHKSPQVEPDGEYIDQEAEPTIADQEVSDQVAPRNAPLVGNPPDVAPPNNPLKPDYRMYKVRGALCDDGDSNPKNAVPKAYKQTYCTSVKIDFVGVWDTVGSVGAIIPQTLPYIDYNPSIITFRHALALDEHRANFVPSLWDHTKTNHKKQSVREVWFRGQHSDIGGGAPPPPKPIIDYFHSSQDTKLSNIPLRWMVQQCLEDNSKTPLAFDYNAMQRYRAFGVLEPRPSKPDFDDYKYHKLDFSELGDVKMDQIKNGIVPIPKYMRTEMFHAEAAYLDKIDVRNEPYESAGKFSLWNILEFFPSTRPAQTENGPEMTHWPNLFKPRAIYCLASDDVYLHVSVLNFLLTRKGFSYQPPVNWLGLKFEQFPKIEHYEGNGKIWPESENEKQALIAALDMGWNRERNSWWDGIKHSAGTLLDELSTG
ncbi:unnamed protein product [Rhizoctonia solani]|uniref:DUF2235 domain-containing protein n=1 Tax=Rhizoctonia solani TaxID=456999 RepID=A0A8H2WD37_9AGAM|nr:unnamed protein product [Rhizoctonia solani]